MDCPNEEKLIRLRFEALLGIRKLEFDLQRRTVKVVHSMEDGSRIAALLDEMGLPGKLKDASR